VAPLVEPMDQRRLAIGQGVYFLATGLWPIVDMESFERVTGRKTDQWLVRTVGVLVSAIGATLMSAGARRTMTREVAGLAVGSAVGLASIDVFYAMRRRISRIYLVDAVLEGALVSLWTVFAINPPPSAPCPASPPVERCPSL